jgi:hypothetical protein
VGLFGLLYNLLFTQSKLQAYALAQAYSPPFTVLPLPVLRNPLVAYRADHQDSPKKVYEARDHSPVRDEYISSLNPVDTLEYIIDYCKNHPASEGYEVGLVYFVKMVASKSNDEQVQTLKAQAIALLNQKSKSK